MCFAQKLNAAVAVVAKGKRLPRMHGTERVVSVAAEKHSGVTKKRELAEKNFLLRHTDDHGQFAHLITTLPLRTHYDTIRFLARRFERACLLQHEFALLRQPQRGVLAENLYAVAERRQDAVSHSVVINAPLHGIAALHGERKLVIAVLHRLTLQRKNGRHRLIDTFRLRRTQGRLLSEKSVPQFQSQCALLQKHLAVAFHVVINTVGERDVHFHLSVGTLHTYSLLCCGDNAAEYKSHAQQTNLPHGSIRFLWLIFLSFAAQRYTKSQESETMACSFFGTARQNSDTTRRTLENDVSHRRYSKVM